MELLVWSLVSRGMWDSYLMNKNMIFFKVACHVCCKIEYRREGKVDYDVD